MMGRYFAYRVYPFSIGELVWPRARYVRTRNRRAPLRAVCQEDEGKGLTMFDVCDSPNEEMILSVAFQFVLY